MSFADVIWSQCCNFIFFFFQMRTECGVFELKYFIGWSRTREKGRHVICYEKHVICYEKHAMAFVVPWQSLLLLSRLKDPKPVSTFPWFLPHFSLCLLLWSYRKSQIFWTNVIYSFLLSCFCLPSLLPEREGLLQTISGHPGAFSHHFQCIPCLRSPRKNWLCLISVSGHLSHSYVPGQCQWIVLHGRALVYRLGGQVSHAQKELV